MSTALMSHTGDTAVGRALSWSALPPGERKRRAVAACRARDTATLQEIMDAWLTLAGDAGATVSPHTRRNYRHGVKTLVAAWTQENLLRPRADAARAWLRSMEATGLKPATIRVHLAAAKALYAGLRWCKATEVDPFVDTRAAKDRTQAKDKRRPYEVDELTTLLAALDTTVDTALPAARTMARYDRVLLLLGAHAGLRASEMMDLRWRDVDLERRRIVVQNGKGGKKRGVIMSSSLAAALGAIPAEMRGEHVLPYRSRGAAWYRMKRLTDQAGIEGGLHRLRHSAGTRMMRETHDLREVAELLGHSSVETARVYSQWADDTQRAIVGKW